MTENASQGAAAGALHAADRVATPPTATTSHHTSTALRRNALLVLLGTLCGLGSIALVLLAVALLIGDGHLQALTQPGTWLRTLDAATRSDILFGLVQVVGGLLAIAITVSAIVVELAATRYNHRITWLFVREPANIGVMSLLTVTAVLCVWVGLTRSESGADMDYAFLIAMVLVSVCLLVQFPYFVFVLAFLSPLSIIEKVQLDAYRGIRSAARTGSLRSRARVQDAVDKLQEVARTASEQSDRSIAMACINAVHELVADYQPMRARLPDAWFLIDGSVAEDPDFVPLAASIIATIGHDRLWFESKIFRQYLSLMSHSLPEARDVAHLIAINTRLTAVVQGPGNPELLELCIRCFNSYLRAAISAGDPRTTYHVMNQYRMLAEALMAQGRDTEVQEIAEHFRTYGQIAHERGMSFLLQTAAADLTVLVEVSVDVRPQLVDQLLSVVLEVDQEIRSETHEDSLLGVRKAQLQLATLFALRGDNARTRRICRDLAEERMTRLLRLRRELEREQRQEFWEITDRGLNFGYLPPERRAQLEAVFAMIDATVAERPPGTSGHSAAAV